MGISAEDRSPRLHVERTGEPTVLRWVCHRPDLDATPVPPEQSTLAGLQGCGSITFLTVRSGDLLVGFADPDAIGDRALIGRVHRAVADAVALPGWSAPSGESAVALPARADQRRSSCTRTARS